MAAQLDHLILRVNDSQRSIDFYTRILGLHYEGERGPFAVIRVTEALTLQLAAWTTPGGEHLAFAMTRAEFDDVFRRARGPGKALYLFDPNEHLIEIRYYES
jgi:catechol 2,3-dioxygenase-like lactoylglutathione lyase family enzyme